MMVMHGKQSSLCYYIRPKSESHGIMMSCGRSVTEIWLQKRMIWKHSRLNYVLNIWFLAKIYEVHEGPVEQLCAHFPTWLILSKPKAHTLQQLNSCAISSWKWQQLLRRKKSPMLRKGLKSNKRTFYK